MTRHTRARSSGPARSLVTGALVAQRLRRLRVRRHRRRRPATASGDLTSSDDALTILIGSSGEAETEAVEDAVAAWSEESGVEAEVQVANDLNQQLSRASRRARRRTSSTCRPTRSPATRATARSMAYGDLLENKDDFYPSLVENFTVDDEFYCAPKDFSTLALDHQHRPVGGRRPDRCRHPDHVGRADRRRARRSPRTASSGSRSARSTQRVGAFMAQAGGGLVVDGAGRRRTAPRTSRPSTTSRTHLDGRQLRVRRRHRRRLGRRGVRQAAGRDGRSRATGSAAR